MCTLSFSRCIYLRGIPYVFLKHPDLYHELEGNRYSHACP